MVLSILTGWWLFLKGIIGDAKPAIESFAVGLIMAVGYAFLEVLTNGTPFSWGLIWATLAGASLNYVTSKLRNLNEKELLAWVAELLRERSNQLK